MMFLGNPVVPSTLDRFLPKNRARVMAGGQKWWFAIKTTKYYEDKTIRRFKKE
jgi:hypothetical protein